MILTVLIFDRKMLRRCFKIMLSIYRLRWQKNLSLHIGKTELVHFLSCRNQSVKMAKTTESPTKSVKNLGVHLDKSVTCEAHVQSLLGKIAEHLSVVMRLRQFCKSSIMVLCYNIYMKPIIQYDLLV